MNKRADVRAYFVALRHGLSAVALCVLVGAISGYAVGRHQPERFRSVARIVVAEPGTTSVFGSVTNTSDPLFIATQIQTAGSRPVLDNAANRLRLTRSSAPGRVAPRGANGLPGVVTVSGVPGTRLIEVAAVSGSAAGAQAVADAVVAAFLDVYSGNVQATVAPTVVALQHQVTELQQRLAQVTSQLRAAQLAASRAQPAPFGSNAGPPPAPAGSPVAQLSADQAALQAELSANQSKLDAFHVDTVAASTAVAPMVPANLPASPISPHPSRNAMVGAGLGVLVGIALAVALERTDSSLRAPSLIERAMDIDVIGLVPRIRGRDRRRRGGVPITIGHPYSAVSEAYRVLWARLRRTCSAPGGEVLLVTSPGDGEGKTTVAVDLGVVAARAGQRVILVSADLRRPKLHQVTGVADDSGLTDLLSGTLSLADVLRSPEWSVGDLRVIPSGPLPDNAADLLSSPRLHETLLDLRSQADLIVVDSAPVLAVADTTILSEWCDDVLLVVRAGQTTMMSARRGLDRLRSVCAPVVGLVLNDARPDADGPTDGVTSDHARLVGRRNLPGGRSSANGVGPRPDVQIDSRQ